MEYLKSTDLHTKTEHTKTLQPLSMAMVCTIKQSSHSAMVFDAEKLKEAVKELKLPHYSDEEREQLYRATIEKKYGKVRIVKKAASLKVK